MRMYVRFMLLVLRHFISKAFFYVGRFKKKTTKKSLSIKRRIIVCELVFIYTSQLVVVYNLQLKKKRSLLRFVFVM